MIKYCKNHPEKEAKCKGLCRSCYEKQLQEINPEYKKRQQENSKNWHIKNKERKAAYDKERRKSIGPRTDAKFFSSIKRRFGITKEEYEKIAGRSGNKCELCGGGPKEGKRLHLDHDHVTGKIRGLLCPVCNWYLHKVESDPELLNRIKKYINQ